MASTLNLETPDPALPKLKHVMGQSWDQRFRVGVSNNFAFGGVNTSLVLSLI
jgi:3-oxoacyl-(acyl-carrier-protein) synthase